MWRITAHSFEFGIFWCNCMKKCSTYLLPRSLSRLSEINVAHFVTLKHCIWKWRRAKGRVKVENTPGKAPFLESYHLINARERNSFKHDPAWLTGMSEQVSKPTASIRLNCQSLVAKAPRRVSVRSKPQKGQHLLQNRSSGRHCEWKLNENDIQQYCTMN